MANNLQQRSSEIAHELEEKILSGSIPPGERLPSEEKLCTQFGASRTAIREAIQQLRGRGLLRSIKGSGTYIADSSLESLGSAVTTYSVLVADAGFLDLIDFRILIETECARLAATNAGEKDILRLRESIAELEENIGTRPKFSKADIGFHIILGKASGNRIYATLLAALERRCIDYAQTNRGDEDWYQYVIDNHREILAAIEAANGEKAADAMRRHLLASRRHYVDLHP